MIFKSKTPAADTPWSIDPRPGDTFESLLEELTKP